MFGQDRRGGVSPSSRPPSSRIDPHEWTAEHYGRDVRSNIPEPPMYYFQEERETVSPWPKGYKGYQDSKDYRDPNDFDDYNSKGWKDANGPKGSSKSKASKAQKGKK